MWPRSTPPLSLPGRRAWFFVLRGRVICCRDRLRLYVFQRSRYLILSVVDCSVKLVWVVDKCISRMFRSIRRG
jgi:hypothetical protein